MPRSWLCRLLPYRYVPFSEVVRTQAYARLDGTLLDEGELHNFLSKGGMVRLISTDKPRKAWGLGHDWDLAVHGPSGTGVVCCRCRTTNA